MKIVLAFDSYKGAVSAVEACAAAADGLARLTPAPQVVPCPLSDGGEGFAEALRLAGGGTAHALTVTGPLGTPVTAELVLLDGGHAAVIEAAQANGLGLVPPGRRSPSATTTRGVGEMLAAAVRRGARKLVVGLGGSATNDGGMGMLAALGWRFLDGAGAELPPVGASLARVAEVVPGETLAGVEIIAACDVHNPLFGPQGAACIYGPQKGASPEEVAALDAGLRHYARVMAHTLGRDLAAAPGAGAAGGLGYALLAALGATFRPGAELAITLSRLEEHLTGAALCFTGEGRTDAQTAFGKLPAAVAACCARAGVPCVCLSGALGEGWRRLYAVGMTAVFSIATGPGPFADAIAHTRTNLADAAEAVARTAFPDVGRGA